MDSTNNSTGVYDASNTTTIEYHTNMTLQSASGAGEIQPKTIIGIILGITCFKYYPGPLKLDDLVLVSEARQSTPCRGCIKLSPPVRVAQTILQCPPHMPWTQRTTQRCWMHRMTRLSYYASNTLPSWAITFIVIGVFISVVGFIWTILRATLFLRRSTLPLPLPLYTDASPWSRPVIQPPPPAYSPRSAPPLYSAPKVVQLRSAQASLAESIASSSLRNSYNEVMLLSSSWIPSSGRRPFYRP
ncbi:hypothetical protein BKA82DRAFT_1007028 [Pisolithus tinctorius]|uniref:Uncharacterized protein n=1 Tax=Pisolithus tinctorius Marx 270 TaxID=870435 RepID=A0A0C3NL86_PISTI|nr:hypothetical protein BKA82DRAFT_1007028 [Pisolithus tinctorius]KIN96073.1 hypothetical protein M404DRAFT_1007028 [Pisolithus tinctorius Marx 270]